MIKSIDTSKGKLHAADLNHALVELNASDKAVTRLIYFSKYQGPDLEVEIDADAHDILSDSPVVPYQRYAKVLLWVVVNRETSCDVYCVEQPGNKYEYSKVTTIDGFHADSIGCSTTSAIYLVGPESDHKGKLVMFRQGVYGIRPVDVKDVTVAVASTSGNGMAFQGENPFTGEQAVYYTSDSGECWLMHNEPVTEDTVIDVVTVAKDTYKNRLALKSDFYGDFLLLSTVKEDGISQTVDDILDLRTGGNIIRGERAPTKAPVEYHADILESILYVRVVGTEDHYVFHGSKWHGPFFEFAPFIYGAVGFNKSGESVLISYGR